MLEPQRQGWGNGGGCLQEPESIRTRTIPFLNLPVATMSSDQAKDKGKAPAAGGAGGGSDEGRPRTAEAGQTPPQQPPQAPTKVHLVLPIKQQVRGVRRV